MNNIIKVAKLDLSLYNPFRWSILLELLLSVFISATSKSLLLGVSSAMCIFGTTPGFTFSIVEKNGMERLYSILPVPKRDIVLGRYLSTCVTGGMALVFSLVVNLITIRALLKVNVTAEDIIASVLMGIMLFTFNNAFEIPGYYKFGSIKGQHLMFLPLVPFIVFYLILIANGVDINSAFNVEAAYLELFDNPAIYITPVLLVCVIAFSISVFASVRIVKNKEV